MKPILWAAAVSATVLVCGCTRDGGFQPISMWNESRLKPLEPSPMPGQASSSLPLPTGTVARGAAWSGDPVESGRSGGRLLTRIPIPVNEKVLARGQERFNIYCAPCHGRLGDGQGMVVRRGFPHPPDYAIPRLRNAVVGHYFDVITHGYGVMYPYAERVPVSDRWAIIAYIRLIQERRPVVSVDLYAAERRRARATSKDVRPTPGEEPAAPGSDGTPPVHTPGVAPGEPAPGGGVPGGR